MNPTERGPLYHQKIASSLLDRRQRQRDEEKLDDYGVAMSFDPVKTPEEAMIEREEAEILAKAMLTRPARQERVLRMHYGIGVEPMTLRQIGETMGITGTAVNCIEHKAFRSLKHPKSILLKKLRPEKYVKERAKIDAWAKQDAEERANYERRKAEEWKRQYEAQQAEAAVGAAEAAARWARAKERLKALDEKRKVANLARWKQDQQDLFDRLHAEAHYVNSLWDKELLRREIAAEQARELEAKRAVRDEQAHPVFRIAPTHRDWLWVASDRKQA